MILGVEKTVRTSSDQIEGAAPLSAAQRRLWILYQLDPDEPSFNRPMAVRLSGQLDLTALRASLQEITKRHEILRTSFCEDSDGEPMQIVLPVDEVGMELIDLELIPADRREIEAQRLAAREARKPFNLSERPPVRLILFRLAPDHHVLLLCMHHIVFDGWSEPILLRELGGFYDWFAGAESPHLPDLPWQYADFARWQQNCFAQGILKAPLEYWKHELEAVRPLELPTDHPRTNARTGRAAQHSFLLPLGICAELKELAQSNHATLFMVLSAAFAALLYRYTGQRDFTVGVPVAGRNSVETESLIGCFMNVIVLRARCSGNSSFQELFSSVRKTALEAYAYQEVPFERIVQELRPERDLHRWPLFQVLFNFRNLPVPTTLSRPAKLRLEPFEFNTGLIGGIDLSFEAGETVDGLNCSFTYPADLFQNDTIERMASHFRALVDGILTDPEQKIAALPLLDPAERKQILRNWNATERVYEAPESVHELFQRQAQRTPKAIAVVSPGAQLTYADLDARSNQLARYLKKQGIAMEDRVGVCLERSCEMLIAILAVLKCGAAYVPLEPTYPAERLDFVSADCNLQLILTQKPLLDRLYAAGARLGRNRVIALERQQSVLDKQDPKPIFADSMPENLAYIIYTSGSTGAPKGVMVTHRGVCNYLCWRSEYFPLAPSDRLLQRSSFSFDDSVWELFEPLSVGATVVMADPHADRDVSYLLELIRRHEITAACLVPSMLQDLLEHPDLAKCSSLKRVTTGAEPLSPATRERFLERLSANLYNGYGPTETTIGATFSACVRREGAPGVTIGRPIANTKVYILDSWFQPVPIGVPGELFIGGFGVARGYVARPELTAAGFFPDPFSDVPGARFYRTGDRARYLADGTIEFLGRTDDQVKIRGHRIELAELDSTLAQNPQISEAAAGVVEVDPYEKRLVAYVVPKTRSTFDSKALRTFLRNRLPAFMLPSAIALVERLPRTAAGKIDRRRLGAIDSTQIRCATTRPPRSNLEMKLSELWAEVLGISDVGIHDDFFDLGGHSLLASRLVARIRLQLTVDLPLRAVFENPTIEALAEFISQQHRRSLVTNIECLSEDEAEHLLTTRT